MVPPFLYNNYAERKCGVIIDKYDISFRKNETDNRWVAGGVDMQFYKYGGNIVYVKSFKENDTCEIVREKTRMIRGRTDDFNQHLKQKAYIFVSEINEEAVRIGMIVREIDDIFMLISQYLQTVELELKETYFEEITFNSFCKILDCASGNEFVTDEADILRQFYLDKIDSSDRMGITYGENIICNCSKSSVYEDAAKLFAKDTFIPELDRIYAGSEMDSFSGHPVHYMIQIDDRETRKTMHRLLLQALYANNRLCSRRYCFLDFRPGDSFSSIVYDALYESAMGGAVIVRYLANDGIVDNPDNCGRNTIETLCKTMKKYRNQVLTVFCLPRECTQSKDVFYENIGNISIIELKEDLISGECAENFVKMLAKDKGICTDSNLFSIIEKDRGYLAYELQNLFDDWYDNKLRTSVYPQYKDIATAKYDVAKSAFKGCAYDELNQMVGIDEAKKVISQILCYHKAQKIFADMGMKNDHPTMHMVFTGNPGTAKTTVARLFARIMKENNLFTEGKLLEVGRGDLVGKHVGWTAPNIKKIFQDARGGVLFIDEAYSLVDDRDGSYGDEAITTIVQEMENHRDEVIVIFAGYPDKMESFLQKNPGLRSRIAYHVPFYDYDTDSLCKIAELIAKQNNLSISEGAYDKMTDIFENARTEDNFGNGRYVRNVIEKAKLAQATRLLSMDLDSIGRTDIFTICAEDIEQPVEVITADKKRIGFCV